MLKRVFDFVVSFFAIVLLIPLFILIALAIKIDSEGPVFFKQKRVGYLGKPFSIFKFRSMVLNSENIGPYYTKTNDLRITRLGRLLRRTSLDELPQLFNVLKGDMSLVGPRPNVYSQIRDYTQDEWDKRNSVKPGITGLHQSTLRSNSSLRQRTEMDLNYIDSHSFYLDMKIILLTIKQIIQKGGN